MYTATVITVSDRCAAGLREDLAGPAVAAMLREAGFDIVRTGIVPDERAQIEAALVDAVDALGAALVITTGGTGFAPRDVTPEATEAVCERMAPGTPEAMRMKSMLITERAMLSRMVAGIRGRSLIINLPGSPKAARENLQAVLATLPHGLEMLRGPQADCAPEA